MASAPKQGNWRAALEWLLLALVSLAVAFGLRWACA